MMSRLPLSAEPRFARDVPRHPALANTEVRIKDFTPVTKNSLRGFSVVELPSGVVIHDVAIHVREDSTWASPPSKPMVDRNGVHMRGTDGKPLYTPIVSFSSRERRDHFSNTIIEALRAQRPELFRS